MQVDNLDVLSSCTSWQIENIRVTSQSGELVLRHGPFFRLNVFVAASCETRMPQAQGYLELTRPGTFAPLAASYHIKDLSPEHAYPGATVLPNP